MNNAANVSNRQIASLRSMMQSTSGKIIVGLLVLAVCIVALNLSGMINLSTANGALEEPESENVRRLPVAVRPAKFVEKLEQKRSYTGTIRAKQKANLGFELTGRVANVLVDEGDFVEVGQILAKLDTQSLEAKQSAMTASLAQAQAVLDELLAGPRQEKIDAMRAQLEEADSNLKLAKINVDRREKLRGLAVSKSEYDRAAYDYQSSVARKNSIQQQLDELTAGTRPEKIAAQRAAIRQLESSVDEIKIQIEKSALPSPFSGKIIQRMIDPGTITTASMPVLKIVDVDNLEALIGIPISTAADLVVNEDYSIIVGQQAYPAKLIAKIQELDSSTRTQNMIFRLGNEANGKVIPGQLGQIEIATNVPTQGFLVPANSLTNGIRGLWSVLLVDPESSRVVRADVQIVYTDGKQALVSGPISEQSQVIVDGTHRVVEGQYVQAIVE